MKFKLKVIILLNILKYKCFQDQVDFLDLYNNTQELHAKKPQDLLHFHLSYHKASRVNVGGSGVKDKETNLWEVKPIHLLVTQDKTFKLIRIIQDLIKVE